MRVVSSSQQGGPQPSPGGGPPVTPFAQARVHRTVGAPEPMSLARLPYCLSRCSQQGLPRHPLVVGAPEVFESVFSTMFHRTTGEPEPEPEPDLQIAQTAAQLPM